MTKANGNEDLGVTSLLRTREAIIQNISDTENQLQAYVLQLTHVEATLRILRPEIALMPARKKPPPLTQGRIRRGGYIRPILAALHEADEPLSVAALARAFLISQGKPGIRISREARDMVRQTVAKLARKGMVRCVGKDGPAQMWELVRDN